MGNLPLYNKTVLITGSTRGIGRAAALEFARSGAKVVIHGRQNSPRVDSIISELDAISQSNGQQVKHAACCRDFSLPLDWDAWVEQCWQQVGPIDCWVNNAGGDVLTGDWAEQDLAAKLEFLLRVDVTASLMLSRAIGRKMRQAAIENQVEPGSFSIVNVGWDQAEQGMAGESGELFATTKGAVMAMTRSLAQSLAPQVRVNCVAPGWIRTDWGDQASEYWNQRAKGESLMERWGTPNDVALAMKNLCSPESSFVSGQVICINGGFRFAERKPE